MGLSDFTWACLWYSPALIIRWLGLGMEQVAWIASSVRIVLALHTFVWLYFFNMLPNMAKELTVGVDEWRGLITRSLAASMWPACLIALGGTLVAPILLPLVFGSPYEAAVRPFQIAIWMIPVAWFSGHFRFSLIAAGQQRWEFAASAVTAVVTVASAIGLGYIYGSVGGAVALLAGGIVNAAVAVAASHRQIGRVDLLPYTRTVLMTTTGTFVLGFSVSAVAGALAGTIAACLVFLAVAVRQANDFVHVLRQRLY
jgi:O-antigen/teichoic acid export membrane protein